MPLYEYQCTKCSRRIEVIQKFSDPPKTKCPTCKGRLEKLISAPAIQFKGTGWYVTDYGGKSGEKGSGRAPSEGSSGDKEKSGGKESSTSGEKEKSAPAASSNDKGRSRKAKK